MRFGVVGLSGKLARITVPAGDYLRPQEERSRVR